MMNEKKLKTKRDRLVKLRSKLEKKFREGEEAAGGKEAFQSCLNLYKQKVDEQSDDEGLSDEQ